MSGVERRDRDHREFTARPASKGIAEALVHSDMYPPMEVRQRVTALLVVPKPVCADVRSAHGNGYEQQIILPGTMWYMPAGEDEEAELLRGEDGVSNVLDRRDFEFIEERPTHVVGRSGNFRVADPMR
ncbi:MAG: hypothetical protein V1908_03535 [Candidatus Peregrinibacteria bacterium]